MTIPASAVRRAGRVALGAGRRFVANDGFVLAGHLAYLAVLSLTPFLVFLVALVGMFGATEAGSYLAAFLLGNLPPEAAGTLEMPIVEVFQEPRGDLLTIGMIGAVWIAATGVEGLRHALNRIEGPVARARPLWLTRTQSVGIVLGFGGVLLLIALGIVLTPAVAPGVVAWLDVSTAWLTAWGVGRYVLAGLVLFGVSTLLYRALPDARPPWRDAMPGAFVVVVLFLAGSGLFSLYVAHVADYAALYGGLGGIVATLTFFYGVGAIFVLGGCVNAAARAERGADQARDRAR